MIDPVSGQIYRPMYNAVNIQIIAPQHNMTPPVNGSMMPPPPPVSVQEDDTYPRRNFYDVPRTSVYDAKKQELKEQQEKPKFNDRVVIIPQQTVINNNQTSGMADRVVPQKVSYVENPIKKAAPKTIEIVKPDEKILQNVAEQQQVKEAQQKAEPKRIEIVKPDENILQNAAKKEVNEVKETKETTKKAEPKKVNVVNSQDIRPVIDINTFIAELTSPDFARQAEAMSVITQLTQAAPNVAAGLVDTALFDTLIGIMKADTSKFPAPSQRQLLVREMIMRGHDVSPQDRALASKLAPVELAEQNKEYAMYTLAALQKLYGSEVEQMNGKIVPFNELPGAKEIIKEIQTNDNPRIRTAGMSSLDYVKRPEYSAEIQAVYKNSTQDENPIVRGVAQKSLKLVG